MTTEGKGTIVIPCYLIDGVPYVLEVDAAGKLAMRAAEIETLLGAGLPAALDSLALKVKEQSPISGFATSANQATMITALQLIDDLRAALGSVNTDDLQVDVKTMPTVTVQAAGGDKIHAIESALGDRTTNANLGAGIVAHDSGAVPTGKTWKITNIVWNYSGTIPAQVELRAVISAIEHSLKVWSNITTGVWYDLQCEIWLGPADVIRLVFWSATAGDDIVLDLVGYQMDAP